MFFFFSSLDSRFDSFSQIPLPWTCRLYWILYGEPQFVKAQFGVNKGVIWSGRVVVLDWLNSCTSPSNITTQHDSDSWFPTEQESSQSRWHVGGSRTPKCHTAGLNVLPRFSKRFTKRESRSAIFLQIHNI
jgi:hypothetical protein